MTDRIRRREMMKIELMQNLLLRLDIGEAVLDQFLRLELLAERLALLQPRSL